VPVEITGEGNILGEPGLSELKLRPPKEEEATLEAPFQNREPSRGGAVLPRSLHCVPHKARRCGPFGCAQGRLDDKASRRQGEGRALHKKESCNSRDCSARNLCVWNRRWQLL
jgi:hypothetical protein